METSLSPRQQALYAQAKLKSIYTKTCVKLDPLKEGLRVLQEAILWRKPVLSLALYASVHVFFWYLYHLSDTAVSLLARVIFWALLVDGFWVIARRDRSVPEGQESRWTRLLHIRRQRKQTNFMTFEEAVAASNVPLEVGEVAKFEVICLRISVSLMWLDNVQLAMRHWNREQPYMLTVLLFLFGLLLCVVGYFISGFWLVYLSVLLLLVWPIIAYYDLVTVVYNFIVTQYPLFTEKFQHYYKIARSHFRKLPEEEFSDYQLQPTYLTPLPNRDPSLTLTLPPFDPKHNVMDSLGSLALNPQGFHYSVDDSLSLDSMPPVSHSAPQHNTKLSRISEGSDNEEEEEVEPISMSDINPGMSHNVQEDLESERQRAGTLSLTPFKDDHNPLHDSFDFDEICGTSDTPSTTETRSDENDSSYSSPYFAKTFGLPSDLISSTPLETEHSNGTLRNRQQNNSN